MATSIIAGGSAEDVLVVRHVRASGTNREIGRTIALAAREAHGELAGPQAVADPNVQRARWRWFEANYPALAERLLGAGDVFGVDAARDDIDLAFLATYAVPAGCSVVHYPGTGTKDGHGILSRHFDFPNLTYSQLFGLPPLANERPLAGDVWVVELHPDDGYASLTIGIMDVMGAMDGVNEAGLAVALLADNESPNQEPSVTAQVGLSEQQIVRYLLDTCATVDEAKQALLLAKQYYFFVPCHFVVADRSGDAFVWEYSPGHNLERIVEGAPELGGRMVCTNHLLHRRPDPFDLPRDAGVDGTAALTYSRWASLASAVGDGGIVTRDDIRAQFRSVRFEAPVPMARTFWHALWDTTDASVEVQFYLRDEAERSVYSPPVRLPLG
jgi:predicted choloylglycine hydrolase